jgi:predicted transcriptional regulator
MHFRKSLQFNIVSLSKFSSQSKIRIQSILASKPQQSFTIQSDASVIDAISHLAHKKLAAAIVMNSEKEVLGIFTARDIVRHINDTITTNKSNLTSCFNSNVTDIMTDASRMV